MQLSVIIVSYKVPYFLEQALLSVQKAAHKVTTEIIVVDNKSEDGTVEMLQEKFPTVRIIANTVNTGFAKANNQGIEMARGKYILFLNPDTVLQEDTLDKVIAVMESKPEVGGLGVKMIDGTGNFLPESKRGFPSPEVAFYKTFGLSSIFPKSKRFNKYHLGYLDKDQNHEVDVLSGAFMLMPRHVLEQIGYWDEAFFMYGEDIDLSYRVIKAGYKNYYCADTTIIHYKGESTKKGSLNYVKTFYEAMIIFARKHFTGSKAGVFIFMLQMAIYFRALLTLCSNVMKQFSLVVIDLFVVYGGLIFIKNTWEVIRFDDTTYYDLDNRLIYLNFPFYVLAWIMGTYLRGGYDSQARQRHIITGIGLGTIGIAAVYAFLPQELRFSRMLILLGMLWAILGMYITRSVQSWMTMGSIFWSKNPQRNLIIIGDKEESQRVLNLLYEAHVPINFIGRVSPNGAERMEQNLLGNITQLRDIAHIYNINEVIFCGKDIAAESIIDWMTKLGADINYKTVPQYSNYVIGSNSKNTAGDLYTIDINFKIVNSIKRRNKGLLDIVYSLGILLLSPILCFVLGGGVLLNALDVLMGKKTWVGYYPVDLSANLPAIKEGVLTTVDHLQIKPTTTNTVHRLNLFYAKDYTSNTDFDIIVKAWRHLGRRKIPKLKLEYLKNTPLLHDQESVS